MIASLKKEIGSFLGSITGYVVICIFLVITSLFLWVFPSEMNILESGYATLDSLFIIAPWVFLFLVPAITMKMIAEEKRTGTIDLLLVRPLSDFNIVLSKFLAAVVLIAISLLPTLLFFITVFRFGNPVGNIDTGAAWGSYIGLFFLASIYASIGLFASSLTQNQVVSFLLGVLLSYLLFMGFDYLASIFDTSEFNTLILSLGINDHYESVSRGVVDSRDLVYFISVTFLFLFLSRLNLRNRTFTLKDKRFVQLVYAVAIVLVLNFVAKQFFFRADLTADKRYTLSETTKKTLGELEDAVFIKIYLEGDLPIEFTKFKKSIQELLEEFRVYSKNIEYNFINPYDYDGEEQKAIFKELYEKNIKDVTINIKGEDGVTQKNIFPGAIIGFKNAETSINLLSNNPGLPHEVNLNNSIQGLEYNFMSVIKNITSEKVDKIAFIEGHGELDEFQVADISKALSKYYQVDRGVIGGQIGVLDAYKAIVIAKPTQAFDEKDKYVIDQYMMKGGKVLWFIDAVNVNADSLINGSTLAYARQLNLQDQLFAYGVRINPVLVKDLQSNFLMVDVAAQGGQGKRTPVPWYYYPLINGRNNHPITKNLNMVKSEYLNPIDTISGSTGLKKTVLLWTSKQSATLNVPAVIALKEIGIKPDPRMYNSGPYAMAVLIEGQFPSVYKNRMLEQVIGNNNTGHINLSKPTSMIVVSDGDIIRNDVNYRPNGNMIGQLGYDRNTNHTFGNKEFVLNTINYLADEDGLINLRSREYKLRLLDKQAMKESKTLIMMVNIVMPLLLIILLGVLEHFYRKRIYNS